MATEWPAVNDFPDRLAAATAAAEAAAASTRPAAAVADNVSPMPSSEPPPAPVDAAQEAAECVSSRTGVSSKSVAAQLRLGASLNLNAALGIEPRARVLDRGTALTDAWMRARRADDLAKAQSELNRAAKVADETAGNKGQTPVAGKRTVLRPFAVKGNGLDDPDEIARGRGPMLGNYLKPLGGHAGGTGGAGSGSTSKHPSAAFLVYATEAEQARFRAADEAAAVARGAAWLLPPSAPELAAVAAAAAYADCAQLAARLAKELVDEERRADQAGADVLKEQWMMEQDLFDEDEDDKEEYSGSVDSDDDDDDGEPEENAAAVAMPKSTMTTTAARPTSSSASNRVNVAAASSSLSSSSPQRSAQSQSHPHTPAAEAQSAPTNSSAEFILPSVSAHAASASRPLSSSFLSNRAPASLSPVIAPLAVTRPLTAERSRKRPVSPAVGLVSNLEATLPSRSTPLTALRPQTPVQQQQQQQQQQQPISRSRPSSSSLKPTVVLPISAESEAVAGKPDEPAVMKRVPSPLPPPVELSHSSASLSTLPRPRILPTAASLGSLSSTMSSPPHRVATRGSMAGSLDASVLPSVHHAPPYGLPSSPSSFPSALRSPPPVSYLRTAASVSPQPQTAAAYTRPSPRADQKVSQSPLQERHAKSESSDSPASNFQRPSSAQKSAHLSFRSPQSPATALAASFVLASSASAPQFVSPQQRQQPRLMTSSPSAIAKATSPESQQARSEWLQSALARRSPSSLSSTMHQTHQKLPVLDGAARQHDDLASALHTSMPVSPPSSAIYGAQSNQWMAALSTKAVTGGVSELASVADGSTTMHGGAYSGHLLARSHVARSAVATASPVASVSVKAPSPTLMPSMGLRRESAHLPPPPRSQQHHDRDRPVVRVSISVPEVTSNCSLHG